MNRELRHNAGLTQYTRFIESPPLLELSYFRRLQWESLSGKDSRIVCPLRYIPKI